MPQTVDVNPETPKAEWADRLPSGPPLRDELARLVDSDGGNDPAENGYFESANDPQFVATEAAQRRFKGQLRRRFRHRASTARKRASG
jgi:hypothetical protein